MAERSSHHACVFSVDGEAFTYSSLHIGNSNSDGHKPYAGCSFPLYGSTATPRGGACRKLKKTPRALESEFSCGTNIINHQF